MEFSPCSRTFAAEFGVPVELLNKVLNVQESDTTDGDSSNGAKYPSFDKLRMTKKLSLLKGNS